MSNIDLEALRLELLAVPEYIYVIGNKCIKIYDFHNPHFLELTVYKDGRAVPANSWTDILKFLPILQIVERHKS